MRQVLGKLCIAGVATGLYCANALASDRLQPYVTLDLGHSTRGQQVSVAASAGLRWPSGIGVALDVTPLDEYRVASWQIGPSGPENYRETAATFLAWSARVDWRFAVSERWSLTPSIGWHQARTEYRFPGEPAANYNDTTVRHDGAVIGVSLDRRLSEQWQLGISTKHYPSPHLNTNFYGQAGRSVTRFAVGLTRLF